MKIHNDVLKAAGVEAVYDKIEEELTELLLSLKHWRQGKASVNDLLEEVADVLNMMPYFDLLHDSEAIAEIQVYKYNRLQDRLDKGEL